MKTSVKSVEDLKRIALARGAILEVGNTKYNTTGEQVKPAKPAPAEPKPPEPPKPATPEKQDRHSTVTENVAVNLDMTSVADAVSRGTERVGEILQEAIKQIQVPESKSGRWLFTVNRDTHGRITTVEAVAK